MFRTRTVLLSVVAVAMLIGGQVLTTSPSSVPFIQSFIGNGAHKETGTGTTTGDWPAGDVLNESYLVLGVVDGDTIDVQINGERKRVRYIGVNTPETVHPTRSVECIGMEASARNQALVAGRFVRLERDVSETDKYGRLLRYVYVADIMVNEVLVAEGYAQVSTYPPDVRYADRFLAAQVAARAAGRGLWGAGCDTNHSSSSSKSTTKLSSDGRACTIKGNIAQNSGERIYHAPGCEYYTQTVINKSNGERWFCSEVEAQAAGWRKAQNCP